MVACVYVVHCIDTEGPLYESLTETFKRILSFTGVEVPPSPENLAKIQHGEIDLNGHEEIAKVVFSAPLLRYNDTWDKIDEMLVEITSLQYRKKFEDSFGNGWLYNWFIMDHVGYEINPRRRDIGYHNIYDHYREFYQLHALPEMKDGFHWHVHPMSTYKEAHRCATSFLNSPHIWESLARRIIDRGYFPNSFRAGFHTERPDSHWFLEQYIPFDFSNQSILESSNDSQQVDLSGGRFGDWRRAPSDWSCYHPSPEDYQVPGPCNRTIFRCLNMGTRLRILSQTEVDKAFERASQGYETILAFTDHDYRSLNHDVEAVYGMLQKASERYKGVLWKNAEASEAAQKVLSLNMAEKLRLETELSYEPKGKQLRVKTNLDSFGSQPFLAIKTQSGRYIVDNFDFQQPKRSWSYTFDEHTLPLDDVDKIGIATNGKNGSGHLLVLERDGSTCIERAW